MGGGGGTSQGLETGASEDPLNGLHLLCAEEGESSATTYSWANCPSGLVVLEYRM